MNNELKIYTTVALRALGEIEDNRDGVECGLECVSMTFPEARVLDEHLQYIRNEINTARKAVWDMRLYLVSHGLIEETEYECEEREHYETYVQNMDRIKHMGE